MESKYKNAYEQLKKKREERQKTSSQTSDRYKDYADAYAALRGEKKTGTSGNPQKFYAPGADSPAVPVKQDTAKVALSLMQNRQNTQEPAGSPLKTDAREVYQKKGTQPVLGGGKTVQPVVKQKSSLSYIQNKGAESFADAMSAIDKTGKAAVPAVKAYLQNLFTESQAQYNSVDSVKEKMADAIRAVDTETAKNIEIRPVIELGKNALEAGKKAFDTSLEQQYAEEKKKTDLLGKDSDYADTNPAYEKARSSKVVKGIGDLNASTAYMLPSVMMAYSTGNPASLVSSVLSASTIASQAYPDAFNEAKSEGATTQQAGSYALREAGNQALGDMLIGGASGVGSGILDRTIGRYAGKALNRFFGSRPMLKAVSKVAADSIGEGAEEVIQSLVSTANQKSTYNPDAKIDAAELVYEGILGALMGATYSLPTLPARYSVYRSDYDTVNAISKAADAVRSENDVKQVEQAIDMMASVCDENIETLKAEKQTEETRESISRLEYIRDGVSAVKEELEAHKEEVVSHNTDMDDALRAVEDGTPEEIVQNVTEFVSVVSDGIEPDKDAVNAALDYMAEEIQNADARLGEAETTAEKEEAALERRMLVVIDNTIRENRESIDVFLQRKRESIDWQGIEESGNAVRRELESIFTRPSVESKQNVPELQNSVAESQGDTAKTVETSDTVLRDTAESGTMETAERDTEESTPKEFNLHHFIHTDTRDGKKMDVFQSTKRLSSEEYQKLKEYMNGVGGYYSRYVKGFVVPNASRIGEIVAFADTDYAEEIKELDAGENIPGSDVVLEKDSDEYSEKHQKVIAEYEEAVDFMLLQYIESVIRRPDAKHITYNVSSMKPETSVMIEREIGINPTGWTLNLEPRMVKHIWERHGESGQADSSMRNTADIARIQYVIDNPDSVERTENAKAYREPHPYLDGKTRAAKSVLISKKVNGTYYVVEAIPDTEKKTAFIVSAYMTKNKKEEFQPADTAAEKRTPGATSDTTSGISEFGTSSDKPVSTTDNTEVSPAYTSVGNDVNTLSDTQTPTTISDRPDTSIAESSENVNTSPAGKISDFVLDGLTAHRNITMQELQAAANDAYGGTMADGSYDVKAMTDALELGVNRYILDLVGKNQGDFNTNNPNDAVESIKEIDEDILSKIPTQTKRTEEQINLQQFSTPPNIAYLASWVANIDGTDTVLEPSAGIGGLASFAKADGAAVYVNELSDSRLAMLKELPFDGFYQENAEQIDNILPDTVSPSVVLMNPPFSSTGGRTKNTTKNAIPHIEQALSRLQDGGRLVAILGKGMADDAPTFKAWYDTLRENYTIRANIGINGENYRKYGTTFDVQMLVIDKTGAQMVETITGNFDDLKEIPMVLKGVRNDRNRTDQSKSAGAGNQADHGTGVYDTGAEANLADTVSERDSGSGTGKRMGQTGNSVRADSGRRGDAGSGTVSGEQPGTVPGTDTAERNGTDGGGLDSGISGSSEGTGSVSERESDSGTDSDAVRGSVGESDVRERTESGGGSSRGDDGQPLVKKKPVAKKAAENDDGVYASYKPASLTVKGAKKHPAILVESSAMSAVSSPELHYVPKLDQKLIDDGALSDAQLENISYAGQAHEQVLKNGARKGYFIGDGTGVGKGRQVSGIILDNFNQGRRKAVWVSEKQNLYEDAVRDWVDLGGKAEDVHSYQKENKKGLGRFDEGIMFITYSTLRGGPKSGKSHLDTVLEWLGSDFDGVIVFDESHNMANSTTTQGTRGAKEPSKAAITANKLQDSVKNARIVYASATGATNIENFAYLQRLGLWGEGTQFVDEKDFITKIGRAGIAAMELVSRDMKAMGVYLARSISFDGVKYDKLNHNLTKDQKYMYDAMSEGWQVVVQNVEKAAQITGSANNTGAKQRINTVWGTMQNFYNAVLTSFSMPSVIKDIEKELKAGHSCVIQLVNTYEAAQEKAVAKMREEGETDYDNLDLTPRQMLESYIMNAFPVQQYEEYLDEKGNKLSRPVTDSAGNPVLNKQAVRMRDELLAKIKDISIPESPIDMLINHFGVEQVAEITGRKSRFINKTDENGDIKKVKDTRDSQKANIAETKDFQDGKKRILVFSEAGATGRSYHADKRAKNQQPRIHYILQPGWRADKAVQSTGRTHRSNQVNTPTYKLVSTDVAGQKRFVTSVARRLEQLGALTKGQRQTGSGIFDASDNMESDLSREALRDFYKRLGAGQLEGIDPVKTLKGMGLYRKFYDEFGIFKLNETVASDIPQFLNRVLALKVDEDNRIFQTYESIRQAYYENALEKGTLDTGMENVRADKVEIWQEDVVHTDPATGAETKYIRATAFNKPVVLETLEDVRASRANFTGLYRMEDGSVRAAYRIADQTDNWGKVTKRYRMQSANTSVSSTMNERNLEVKAEKIPESQWDAAWAEAVKDVPEFNETEVHMITGALLPIWNQLPSDGTTRAMRITAADGTQYLGRIIPPKQIDSVLRSFDVKGTDKAYTGRDIQDSVLKKAQTVVFNGQYGGTLTVSRRRVSGENRMEVTGNNLAALKIKYPDIISETIEWKTRYFIPSGEKGNTILSGMIEEFKIRSIGKDSDGDVYYSRKGAKETIRESRDTVKDAPVSLDALKLAAEKMFRVPINYGKTEGKAGLYKTREGTIRVAQPGDFLTIAHEIGHRLERRYSLHELAELEELRPAFTDSLKEDGYEDSQIPYELVAEYVKSYLENADAAVQNFPQFTDAMFAVLDRQDTDNLHRLSEMSNAYFASDTGKRAQAAVHNRAEETSPLLRFSTSLKEAKHDPKGYIGYGAKQLWDGFVTLLFDDLHALKRHGSTYDTAMRERQANSVIRGWLEGNATDKYGKVLGGGLTGRLSEFGITPENRNAFDSYLVDLAALDHMKQERKNPSGRPMGGRVYADERVQADTADRILRAESKHPGFHDAAKALFQYDDFLLGRAVQSGILSSKTAKEWKEKYPHYSPLYRVMDDKKKIGGKARSRCTDQNNVFKGFKGSGRDIYSPVENRMIQTETVVKAAMRNDVALAFFDFIDSNDGMGIFAEKVPQSMYKDVIGLFPAYEKLLNFDFKSLENLSDGERQNVLDEVQEAMGNVVESWKPKQFQGKNVVAVMRNGKPEFYEIHDKAVLDALTSLSAAEMSTLGTFFNETTKTFKVLTTGSNPFFAFTNFIRDTQSGYISSSTTANPVRYTVDLVKAIGDTLKKSEEYNRFMDAGGGYEGSMTRDMKTLRSVEWEMVPHSTIERILHTPVRLWDGFARLVDIGESAQRLAEFKRAEKAGMDCLEAMRKQQEVTTNFSRRGKLGKQIDMVIPYFNASLQSFYHLFDVLSGAGDPKAKKKAWAKFITANLTMSLLQQAFQIIGTAITGEDQEEEYGKLSGYIKNAYWCIPQGNGKFIRIPKQKDFMLLSTILDRTVEYAYAENPRAFYEFADYMTGVLMAPHSVEDVTIFGSVYALAKNETFTGAPIVPTAYQNLIPEEQFNENTSAAAKSIGALLNVSPMQVQFVLDDNTGFVGQFIEYFSNIKSAVKTGGIAAGGKAVLDEFTSTFRTDNAYSTDEISYFYDTRDGYDARAATYKIRGNGEKYDFYDTYGAYKYGKIADVYSKCNGLIKAEPDEDTARTQRQVLNAFIKSVNDTEVSEMDEEISAIAEASGTAVSDIAPYIVTPDQITVRENNKSYSVELTVSDMLEYYTQASILFELNYPAILQSEGTATDKAAALEAVRKEINSYMRDQWFRRIMERDGAKTK